MSCFTTRELTTNDTDVITKTKRLRGEGNWTISMVEHETEHVHLTVGNNCQGMTSKVIGVTCLVCQEVIDVGEFDDFQTFTFCDMNKEDIGNKHTLYLFFLSCTPDTRFHLSCHIGFIAQSTQSLTTSFLCVSANNGDKPLAVWHAYGVVNFLS